ncbi:GNAT family N-acetyltransferase [Viridibacillus arvi]|uniref:GNAT family N-acetyltransferase n=1 Tax=Viridibacillus arvi TaxID=263475 RepID=UPI0034CFA19F
MRELYFEDQHIDYIGKGENKFTLFVAFKDDPKLRVIGYLDYSTIDKELYIDMVEVNEEHRDQGVGKALYRKLHELNADMHYMKSGYYTNAGSHIRKWFEEEILKNRNTVIIE